MRQAGRYLPEFREVRRDRDVLDTVKDPSTVVELTLQPLHRMPVDAAVLFSDIMVPIAAIGVPVRIEPGRGPIVDAPVRRRADLARLRPLEPEEDLPHVLEAIRLLRRELSVPLIGFTGAPFTLASYLVEGGPSTNYARTKALMLGDPRTWDVLIGALVDLGVRHVHSQVTAGAEVIQVFDSWAGGLSAQQYSRHVGPAMERLFGELVPLGVPIIHFGVGTGHLLEMMACPGVDAVGVDWRIAIDDAWDRVGHDRAVQGNLDPAALLAPWRVVEHEAKEVLSKPGLENGHIFNLGHGVLPQTPVETLQRLVDLVHATTERQRSTDA